jgi:hypothetical protein
VGGAVIGWRAGVGWTRAVTIRWACAGLLTMAVAAPVTSTTIRFIGLARSTWLRIVVDADQPSPPRLHVAYGDHPDEALPVAWEAAERSTLLGLNTDGPARLLAIDTDRGPAPPWLVQTWAPHWERVANPPALLVRGPGIVEILGSFRRLTLTFEPAPATVHIGWLDRHETVPLAGRPGPSSVTLTIPAVHRGWVLLPPRPIERLAIGSDEAGRGFSLLDATLRGAQPQAWSASSGLDGVVRAGGEVALAALRPLNHVSIWVRLAIWSLVTACGLLGLWGLRAVAVGVNRTLSRYELVTTRSGSWIGERTKRWTLGRVVAAVALCTLSYHLSYVLAVPAHFTFDSLGYYAFGRNFLHSHHLGSIATCRTPGYPGVVALSIFLFGDGVQPILVLQHLALCALGAVIVWFLYPRAGPLWSGIGGLLGGVSPVMSIAANIVWTEALFTTLATAALLVFLHADEPRPRAVAAAGLLAGLATLVRPNGIVLVALMVVWLFVKWWCSPSDRTAGRRLVLSASLMVAIFALVIAPWLVHMHRVAGAWALSDANCSQEGQTHVSLPRGVAPTNIFQLAGFMNLASQSDAVATLAISEPYRVFFQFFPARHRYYVEHFLPWPLIYDERFPGELLREYVRAFPGTYFRQVRDALVFNLSHVSFPGASVYVYPDVAEVLDFEITRAYPIVPKADPRMEPLARSPAISWSDAEILLTQMTATWAPRQSVLRSLHLRLNRAAASEWGWIMALGALGGVICLVLPGQARLVVLAAHAFIVAAAPAVVAMGADRYAMVGEPALYVLAVLLVSFMVHYRVRRRAVAADVMNDAAVA